MDETDILIKAYDNKYNLVELNKLYKYLVDNRLKFTSKQLTYLFVVQRFFIPIICINLPFR